MLAKNVNDNAYFLNERGACEFFASKLAPTDGIRASPLPHFERISTQGWRDSIPNSSHTDSAKWNVAFAAGIPQ